APPGAGVATTFGFRDLGYQVGGSVEALFLDDGGSTYTAGPLFGVNLYPLVVLGEANYRINQNDLGDTAGIYTYVEANYLVTRGLTALAYYTWARPDMDSAELDVARATAGLQWDVLPAVQFAAQYRLNFLGGSQSDSEFLLWTHLYY
ncbi:MAG: hypothetical protein AAFQ82_21930, partial [Myxococcota bacterium]